MQSCTEDSVAETAHNMSILQQRRPAVPPQRISQDDVRWRSFFLLRLMSNVVGIQLVEMIDDGPGEQDRKLLQDRLIFATESSPVRGWPDTNLRNVGHRISFRRGAPSPPAREQGMDTRFAR